MTDRKEYIREYMREYRRKNPEVLRKAADYLEKQK